MNYNNTSENVECPICMDCILDTKNRVTTECGHCFHTNCLMTSVAHNGFGCPYCRTSMAEEIKDDDEDEDDDDDDDWGSVDSGEEDDDRALRGFRFMFNRLAGEPNDQEDHIEEDEDEEAATAAAADEVQDGDKPSPEYITQKLSEQGVTMAQLVKVMLTSHDEYSNEESFDRIDDKIYGKLRIIISNYRPEPVVVQQEIVVATPLEAVGGAVDFDAQPKNSRVTSRRMMTQL
jgi:hypothetical protein